MELTRCPFPTVMARVEVPCDMKQEREMDVRGRRLLTTHLKYQGNALLDIKIHPFLDRKEQSHLLFRSYLPMHRFYCRFERSSNNNSFYYWSGRPLLSTPPATYIINFVKMDIF